MDFVAQYAQIGSMSSQIVLHDCEAIGSAEVTNLEGWQ